MPTLRPLTPDDHEVVLSLNALNLQSLSVMSRDRLRQLAGWAHRFDVVDFEGAFAGFVVAFAPDSGYDSENYRWFTQRFGADFYYLDRIVLEERFRRRGLGGFVYDEVERVAAAYGRLTLEVNVVPANEPSLAFHYQRGFVEVGRRGDEEHMVSLLEKPLASPPGTAPESSR